eukprot:6252591-Amphidinium_carterae.1
MRLGVPSDKITRAQGVSFLVASRLLVFLAPEGLFENPNMPTGRTNILVIVAMFKKLLQKLAGPHKM